jgi:hypothetical protein
MDVYVEQVCSTVLEINATAAVCSFAERMGKYRNKFYTQSPLLLCNIYSMYVI